MLRLTPWGPAIRVTIRIIPLVIKRQNFYKKCTGSRTFSLRFSDKNNVTVWVQLPSHPPLPLLILRLLSPPLIAVN